MFIPPNNFVHFAELKIFNSADQKFNSKCLSFPWKFLNFWIFDILKDFEHWIFVYICILIK